MEDIRIAFENNILIYNKNSDNNYTKNYYINDFLE